MARQYRNETAVAFDKMRIEDLVEKYLNEVLYPCFPNWRTSEQRALAEFIKRHVDDLHMSLLLANEAYGKPQERLTYLKRSHAVLLQIEFETRTAYAQRYISDGKRAEIERYEGMIGAKLARWIKVTQGQA